MKYGLVVRTHCKHVKITIRNLPHTTYRNVMMMMMMAIIIVIVVIHILWPTCGLWNFTMVLFERYRNERIEIAGEAFKHAQDKDFCEENF